MSTLSGAGALSLRTHRLRHVEGQLLKFRGLSECLVEIERVSYHPITLLHARTYSAIVLCASYIGVSSLAHWQSALLILIELELLQQGWLGLLALVWRARGNKGIIVFLGHCFE